MCFGVQDSKMPTVLQVQVDFWFINFTKAMESRKEREKKLKILWFKFQTLIEKIELKSDSPTVGQTRKILANKIKSKKNKSMCVFPGTV